MRSFGWGLAFDRAADSHPLLWSAFTLLAFDELERHINLQQLTTFADDYLASWDISSALQLNNACVQAGKLIDTLMDLGMQIAVDKGVILLAIGGMQATPAPKRIVTRSRKSRALRVPTKRGVLQIPICREHTYLGRKIGYGLSDRSTVMYRIKQSWHLFHRLHHILNCKVLPEPTRIRLWVACVRSVMCCGLTTVLLDVPTAGHLRSQVRKQLRLVTRSPAHLSHEPNHLFLERINVADPIRTLHTLLCTRVDVAKRQLSELQPTQVQTCCCNRIGRLFSDSRPQLPS